MEKKADSINSRWKIFLYFWFFALLGHLLEVVWVWFTKSWFNPFNIPTITPLAVPYWLGVVAVITCIHPIYKKFKRPNILLIFILSTLVTACVEFLSAAVIVAYLGYNPFWDYSALPYNFMGYICLKNVLLFGLIATLFIHFLFPITERIIQKHSVRRINDLSALLFATYVIDLIIVVVGRFI